MSGSASALAHLSKDWLWANIAFDRAQLPFVSRFVLNARPPKEKTRKEALDFATKRGNRPGMTGRGISSLLVRRRADAPRLPSRLEWKSFCRLCRHAM